jgi:hypothetical protein
MFSILKYKKFARGKHQSFQLIHLCCTLSEIKLFSEYARRGGGRTLKERVRMLDLNTLHTFIENQT